MAKIVWDQTSERLYETGVRCGVLYPEDSDGAYPLGVAWNGLTAITESPSGAEITDLYADDIKYLSLMSSEDMGLTVEAYTYPDEFALCDGSAETADGTLISQQERKSFGLSYRTIIGNDVDNNNYGYKLHLVYGAKASPTDRGYSTVNDSPEAITFSWEINTTPISVDGYNPTSLITIDSTKVDADKLATLEDILYGAENAGEGVLVNASDEEILNSDGNMIEIVDYGSDGYLPLPEEVISIMS